MRYSLVSKRFGRFCSCYKLLLTFQVKIRFLALRIQTDQKKLSHTELQLESLEGSFGLSLHAFHPDEPCLNLTDVNSAAFCEKRVQISKEIMIQ